MKRVAFLIALAALPAAAQDAGRGQQLYETHCFSCHYERIHRRDPARSLVKNHAQLRTEVARRAGQAGHRLALEDLEDIAEYLDRTHYRFDGRKK